MTSDSPVADDKPAADPDFTPQPTSTADIADTEETDTSNTDTPETVAAVPETATRVPTWMRGHPILWYSIARLVVLLVVGGILYLFGARGVLLLLLALLISGLVSFLVLDRLRNVVSLRVVERAERTRSSRQQRQAEEDDLL